MAIFHLVLDTKHKSKNQSARAKYNYDHRKEKFERTASQIAYDAFFNLPKWANGDPKKFWKGVDDQPRQKTQLCRTIEVSLPKEVSLDEQVRLVNEFVSDLLDGDIVPWGFAIHDKHDGNPHAHIQLAFQTHNDGIERDEKLYFKRADKKVPERGGALRSENLLAKDFLDRAREKWESHLNGVLVTHGIPLVTRKSFSEREVEDLQPQIHLGSENNTIMKDGGTNERIKKYQDIAAHNRRVRKLRKEINALRSRIAWRPDDKFGLVDDCPLVDDCQLLDDAEMLGVENGNERGRGTDRQQQRLVRVGWIDGRAEKKSMRKLQPVGMGDEGSVNDDLLPGDSQAGLGNRGAGRTSDRLLTDDQARLKELEKELEQEMGFVASAKASIPPKQGKTNRKR